MNFLCEFVRVCVTLAVFDFTLKGLVVSAYPNEYEIDDNITHTFNAIEKRNVSGITSSDDYFETEDCISSTKNLDVLTQNRFLEALTSECRYDKLMKPDAPFDESLNISVRMDINHIELLDQLEFQMDTIIVYRYLDSRLNFEHLSPKRGAMRGRDTLKSKIWIPHLVVEHEKGAKIMGLESPDVFVTISPQGQVTYSFRTTVMIHCWMDFRKFPFDKQVCGLNFTSWIYNTKSMMLHWEKNEPVKMEKPLHLTAFNLENIWVAAFTTEAPAGTGAFEGQYSVLEFKFKVAREIGYYLLDYFIPSIMLVMTSWVTFWLQADNGPPRTTLGTSTMLSFITLATGQTKKLPKVSYIKISDVWFLACTIFIFASLVEFAFVNLIWRRKKSVELKKVNSKYIFKSTLTPSLARKELYESTSFDLPYSTTSLTGTPKSVIPDDAESRKQEALDTSEVREEGFQRKTWTTMTPHEVANWIDKRSRVAFPLAFLIFNIFFWISALSVSS